MVKAVTVFVCVYERNAEVGMPVWCRLSVVQKGFVVFFFSFLWCLYDWSRMEMKYTALHMCVCFFMCVYVGYLGVCL